MINRSEAREIVREVLNRLLEKESLTRSDQKRGYAYSFECPDTPDAGFSRRDMITRLATILAGAAAFRMQGCGACTGDFSELTQENDCSSYDVADAAAQCGVENCTSQDSCSSDQGCSTDGCSSDEACPADCKTDEACDEDCVTDEECPADCEQADACTMSDDCNYDDCNFDNCPEDECPFDGCSGMEDDCNFDNCPGDECPFDGCSGMQDDCNFDNCPADDCPFDGCSGMAD